jgi:hypothetical protein
MTQTTVSNAKDLAAALSTAVGGDTVVLKAGDYGALNLKGAAFASNVTIESESPLGAHFTNVELSNVDHLAFSGVDISGEFKAVDGANNITLANSAVKDSAYFMNDSGVTLNADNITGGMNSLIFNDDAHVSVSQSIIHSAESDQVRITGACSDVTLQGNCILDSQAVKGDHPDMIQFMTRDGHTPTDVKIVGNVLYDDPATGATYARGVFINQPGQGYKDILVQDNLIDVGSPNGIYVNGGISNVVVKGNVMPEWPDGSGGSIRVCEKEHVSDSGTLVEHNIGRQFLNETTPLSNGVTFTDNHQWNAATHNDIASVLNNWGSYLDGSYEAVPHHIAAQDILAY